MLKLEWKRNRYQSDGGPVVTEENAAEYENTYLCAEAEFGPFVLKADCNDSVFKDGTRACAVYLFVPCADSKEWITLARVRGHLLDAIKEAERKLFEWNGQKYRIPAEYVEVIGV